MCLHTFYNIYFRAFSIIIHIQIRLLDYFFLEGREIVIVIDKQFINVAVIQLNNYCVFHDGFPSAYSEGAYISFKRPSFLFLHLCSIILGYDSNRDLANL